MTKKEAFKLIFSSNASSDMKHSLATIVSEFETFLQIKKRCNGVGLMTACYKNFGVKFIGMYNISTYEDCVLKAQNNNLLF